MKLALIGKGQGKELAPLKGYGVTTWGVNDIVGHRDVDVCFFMDKHLMEDTQMQEIIVKSTQVTKTPVYCIKHFADIPTSIEYPLQDITDIFGTDNFSDSFCYMIALAIHQGFKEFDIYGFNYAYGSKYVEEKPDCQYWLGVAAGLGVTLNLYGKYNELLKTKENTIYAYNMAQSLSREKIKVNKFEHSGGEYSFNVEDRFTIVGLMPMHGNYSTLSLTQKLRRDLTFTLEENKKLNIRQIENKKTGQPTIIWDNNDIPDKTLDLTDAEVATIRSWLLELDRREGLNYRNLKTYEKWCLDGNTIDNMDAA